MTNVLQEQKHCALETVKPDKQETDLQAVTWSWAVHMRIKASPGTTVGLFWEFEMDRGLPAPHGTSTKA